ncbi:isochorismate synthase [Castellaniella hirudinis]|uniref:isochorismate synthase n=1 Tax=Castellaniella hirudinis TaxID=1144617 RepID=UPI0039C41E6F
MDMLTRASSKQAAGPAPATGFQAGDCLFATEDEVFHGRGCLLQAAPQDGVSQQAASLLAQAADSQTAPVLLGLLPYDPALPAQLRIPRETHRPGAPAQLPAMPRARTLQRREHPSRAAYEQGVRDALHQLDSQPALRKLVLARTLQLELAQDLDLHHVIQRLWQRNPHGYTYAMPLGDDRRYFIGASPELLVRRRGRQVTVHPLAGTATRHADPALDADSARTLLDSPKDLHEHAVVVEAIDAVLRPLCRTLDIPARPSLTATARLWHLGTPIQGELADPAITALDLALALHPTPAVCGLPTADARRAIARIEPFERGYFAGAVGWCDHQGDGAWAVAIRCAQAIGRQLTLYAGAGIVPGSVPAQECIETGNKLRTVLDALGIDTTP